MMKKINKISNQNYTILQITGLTILRVLIGWHFLYEGLIKLSTPDWSAKSYLEASVGPFASYFTSLAAEDSLLQAIDFLNVWGLILIGIGLILGLCTKISSMFGFFLLLLYYLSYPPFGEGSLTDYADGNFWIVNRNLIEMSALFLVMVFPARYVIGVDWLLFGHRKQTCTDEQQAS